MGVTNIYATPRPIDPREEYGVLGDGAQRKLGVFYASLAEAQAVFGPHVTDLNDQFDWAAIQAVINRSLTTTPAPAAGIRTGVREVRIPQGRWVINRPLQIWSAQDFSFMGSGPGTQFMLGYAADQVNPIEAMLDLNGVAYCRFGDFSFVGTFDNTITERVIWYRWNNTQAYRSSMTNQFRGISIRNIRFRKAGIEIGQTANQEDTTSWDSCTIDGDARWHGPNPVGPNPCPNADSWVVGTGVQGNNLIHDFYACNARGPMRRGLSVLATGARWSGGSIQSCYDADLYVASDQEVTVQGVRSENSGRLLVSGGPASFPAKVSVSDYEFTTTNTANPDGQMVQWKLAGSLNLRNVRVKNPGSAALTMQFTPGGPLAVTVDGVAVERRTMAQALVATPSTALRVLSFVDVNAAGNVTAIESNTPIV